MNRVLKGSAIRQGKAYIHGATHSQEIYIAQNGELEIYWNAANRMRLRIDEIQIEDESPQLAEALHKLAEEAERNTRLADNLREEMSHTRQAHRMYEIAEAKHKEEIEELEKRLQITLSERDDARHSLDLLRDEVERLKDLHLTLSQCQETLNSARRYMHDHNYGYSLTNDDFRDLRAATSAMLRASRPWWKRWRNK